MFVSFFKGLFYSREGSPYGGLYGTRKGYLSQASGIWKCKDFTSWSIFIIYRFRELIVLYVHPKKCNHFRSQSGAIMALDHSILGVDSVVGSIRTRTITTNVLLIQPWVRVTRFLIRINLHKWWPGIVVENRRPVYNTTSPTFWGKDRKLDALLMLDCSSF